ncbi:MAG: hypothetical protein LBH18_03830 [Spirochaetaceae bacterium]|jgi:hypothetical protein|nr:hypothetical protein [Spirochaetaceae bacterium]
MPKAKGAPKTGGRKKGTPNKTTAEFKALIGDIVYKNLETIESEFKKKEGLNLDTVGMSLAIAKALVGYVVPKQAEQKISLDDESVLSVKESIEKLNDLFK